MSADNYASLFEKLRSNWTVLVLGDPIPGLAERVEHAVQADIGHLTQEADAFDLITCCKVIHSVADAFETMLACRQALKPAGSLWLETLLVPCEAPAARYISAFYRLRADTAARYYAEYEWRGILLDADLVLETSDISAEEQLFAEWVQDCRPYVTQRLEIMLKQAPVVVSDWLHPEAIGTAAAAFTEHRLRISARKPG